MASSFEMSQFPEWVRTVAETVIVERQISFDELVIE